MPEMPPRRIAVFHGGSFVWNAGGGLSSILRERGYSVLDCGSPRFSGVPIEALREVDLIILVGPEWVREILLRRYADQWGQLSMPKVAWYVESAYRDDQTFDFLGCRALADLHYYPAMQDAEEFGGKWLPFGTDTAVFRPMPVEKRYGAAFLGTLYRKRMDYLKQVESLISIVPQIRDENALESAKLLVEAYNAMQIFVNLPAYSRLLVGKVTEVMACGTMLVTPALDHPSAAGNMTPFVSGKHLIYYDASKPKELAAILEHYLNSPADREAIALAGCREVREHYTLWGCLQVMLADAEAYGRRSSSSERG